MVRSVMSLGRNGVSDWLLQRLSAIVLAVYFVGLMGYLLFNPQLDYAQWQNLFSATWMRVATLLALVSLCVHAWIGLWIIATDYLTTAALGSSANVVRVLFLSACVILIFTYLVWGIQILWGN